LKTFARNRFRYWPLSLVCALFLVSATTSQAESYSEPEFYSLKDWAPIHTWEYVAIPAMNAATLTIIATIHPPPRWRGGILFDNWARGGLTLKSEAAQTHAGDVSTVLTVSLGFFPVLIDSGLLTWWVHERRDLAWQMFVLDAEVLSITGLVTIASQRLVGRERPAGGREADSFFSGHASLASSAATLICLQHLDLALLGNKAADGTVCGVAAASAVATGFLRIMANRHYASDVIIGTGVGVGTAFLVYKLKVNPTRSEETAIQLLPVLKSNFLGLSLSGIF
jgi:membrane-associated phospholipid phosphatase